MLTIENDKLFYDWEYGDREFYSLLIKIEESDPSITELVLKDVEVDTDFFEDFCKALGKNHSITKLSLVRVRIGNIYPDDPLSNIYYKFGLCHNDVEVFFNGIEDNTTLKSLVLDQCFLNEYYDAYKLRKFVKHHPQLEHLQLHNVSITHEAEEEFLKIKDYRKLTLLELVNIEFCENKDGYCYHTGEKLDDYYLKKIYDADVIIGYEQIFVI